MGNSTPWVTYNAIIFVWTIDACASPPPPPARRVSADNRWRASPASSGNTSPIVLQRFYHQSQQRRSRVDLHSTPRHRSLSREHSNGRSPEPPPRTGRPHPMLGHDTNGVDAEPPSLHERLHPHPPSPLLLNDRYARLSEGRSQSLTRAEPRNGFRSDAPAPHPSRHRHDDQEMNNTEHIPTVDTKEESITSAISLQVQEETEQLRCELVRFPADNNLKQQWITKINRPDWTPTKYTKICSCHFNDADFIVTKKGHKKIKKGTLPSLKLDLSVCLNVACITEFV